MALPEYVLRVQLEDVEPPVWRLVRVPGGLSFAELHVVLQSAMGWEDRHLYCFEVGGDEFLDPSRTDDVPRDALDARHQGLADLDPGRGLRFRYVYDFGDWWSHRIRVEDVDYDTVDEPDAGPARCTNGAGRCPPEDCGGAAGYREMLDAPRAPSDPQHGGGRPRIGADPDPTAFSPEEADAALRELFEPSGRLAGGTSRPRRPRRPSTSRASSAGSGPELVTGSAGAAPGGGPEGGDGLQHALSAMGEAAGGEGRIDASVRSVAEEVLRLAAREHGPSMAREPSSWAAGALHAAFRELRRWRPRGERMTPGQLSELFGVPSGSVSSRSRRLREAASDVRFLPFSADAGRREPE